MSNENPYGINKDASNGAENVPTPPSGTVPPNPTSNPAEGASGAPQGQYPLPSQSGYQSNYTQYPVPPQGAPQAPQSQYPAVQVQRAPRDLSVAYAFLYFLGVFGGHKFYLGQTAQGVMYLAAYVLGAVLSFVGIGFLIFVGMAVLIYADIRTMQEQLVRSEQGETFTANIFQFVGKAFK